MEVLAHVEGKGAVCMVFNDCAHRLINVRLGKGAVCMVVNGCADRTIKMAPPNWHLASCFSFSL